MWPILKLVIKIGLPPAVEVLQELGKIAIQYGLPWLFEKGIEEWERRQKKWWQIWK